jgi:hypothetical protein
LRLQRKSVSAFASVRAIRVKVLFDTSPRPSGFSSPSRYSCPLYAVRFTHCGPRSARLRLLRRGERCERENYFWDVWAFAGRGSRPLVCARNVSGKVCALRVRFRRLTLRSATGSGGASARAIHGLRCAKATIGGAKETHQTVGVNRVKPTGEGAYAPQFN